MSEENAAAYAASASGAGDRNGVERAGRAHPLHPTANEPMGGMPEQRWLGWWAADIDAGRSGIDGALPTPTFGPRHGEPDGGSGSARHAPGTNGGRQHGHGFDTAEPVPTEPSPAPTDTRARLAGTTGPSAPDGGDPVPIASPADPPSGSPAADAAWARSAPHPDQVGGPGLDRPAVPSPRPRSAAQLPPQPDRRAATSTGDAPVDPVSGLRRRVPQAHLVPELRGTPSAADTVGSRLSEHATDAADALSRYQASRQAARTAVEDGQRWSS
jgi:hypothetical protein